MCAECRQQYNMFTGETETMDLATCPQKKRRGRSRAKDGVIRNTFDRDVASMARRLERTARTRA